MSAKMKVAVMGIIALLFLGGIAWRQFGGDAPALPPIKPVGDPFHVALDAKELPRGSSGASETPEPAADAAGSAAANSEGKSSRQTGAGAGGLAAGESRGVPSDRPGEVRGNIVSDEAGIPVEGARIVLKYDYTESGGRWPKGGMRELSLVTDRAGEFLYEDVPAGVYEIRVEHDDYAPRTLTGVRVGEGAGLEGFSVRMISDLRKLGSVEGRVVDGFGSPVSGARVVVHSTQDGGKASSLTDEDGVYRVERLLPGYYSVSLTKEATDEGEGRLWQRTLKATVLAGRTIQVDFKGSGTLTGVVLDSEEKPIKHAMVILHAVERSEKTASRRVNTAEDGTFRIENAGIGLYRLTVGGTSAGWFSVEAMTVDLGGSDQEVRIRLEAGEITGRLLLEDGKPPLSRGLYPSIVLFPAEGEGEPKAFRRVGTARPDRTGVYRFRGLVAGKYRLRTYQAGYQCRERDVELDWAETAKDVNLTLRRLVWGTLDVKVVDPEGKPVDGVILNYSDQGRSGRGVNATHPAPGRYVATKIEVGNWTLHLIRPGMKSKRVPIEVREGKTTSVTVTMEPQ